MATTKVPDPGSNEGFRRWLLANGVKSDVTKDVPGFNSWSSEKQAAYWGSLSKTEQRAYWDQKSSLEQSHYWTEYQKVAAQAQGKTPTPTAATTGFHFTPEQRATLLQGTPGLTNADIDNQERRITGTPQEQTAKAMLAVNAAQTNLAVNQGLINANEQNTQVITAYAKDFGGKTDATEPLLTQLQEPFKWSKEQITALQDQLEEKIPGFKGTEIRGTYDAATIEAFHKVVLGAVEGRKIPMDYLKALPPAKSTKTPYVAGAYIAPTKKPLDDKTLALSIQDAFKQEFGRGPTAKELSTFTQSYRARENQYFSQEDQAARADYAAKEKVRLQSHNAGVDYAPTGSGGEITSAGGQSIGRIPTPGVFVQSDIQNSTEGQAYRAAKAGLDLRKLMESGGR